MRFRFRKPRLRISKKGKIRLSGGGISFGGRHNRINFSKSGLSATVGGRRASYNTRRGCSIKLPFLALLLLSGIGLLRLLVQ